MKIQKKFRISLLFIGTAALSVAQLKPSSYTSAFNEATVHFIEANDLISSNLRLFADANANEEPGDAGCNSKPGAAWAACFQKNSNYQHGALGYFNNTLCMLNKGFTSEVETTLCHFHKSMGMNPDKGALPYTVTKTLGQRSITMTVQKPTESFAAAAGYDAKGTVTVNGTNFVVVYWGGTGESSKGFLIQGVAGLKPNAPKHPTYIQWDRTNPDAQFVKVFTAKFASTYLGSVERPNSNNPKAGDRAMFGQTNFNSSTKAITTQTVLIEGQRGSGNASTKACFKMYATGTKGGNMTVAKTQNSLSDTGHSITSTATDNTDMDAVQVVDSTSTANGTGTSGFGSMTVSFAKSCNDLKIAGDANQPFANNEVNFAATPADIFP